MSRPLFCCSSKPASTWRRPRWARPRRRRPSGDAGGVAGPAAGSHRRRAVPRGALAAATAGVPRRRAGRPVAARRRAGGDGRRAGGGPAEAPAVTGARRQHRRPAAPRAAPGPPRSRWGCRGCSSARCRASSGRCPVRCGSACRPVAPCSSRACPRFPRRAGPWRIHRGPSVATAPPALRSSTGAGEREREAHPASKPLPAPPPPTSTRDRATQHLVRFLMRCPILGGQSEQPQAPFASPRAPFFSITTSACCPFGITMGATMRPPTAS